MTLVGVAGTVTCSRFRRACSPVRRSERRALMIGYFLRLHRFPQQFKRMFRAIYAPGNSYAIHVDKNSVPKFAADIADFLKPYQGVAIIESQKALWGG